MTFHPRFVCAGRFIDAARNLTHPLLVLTSGNSSRRVTAWLLAGWHDGGRHGELLANDVDGGFVSIGCPK
jgi:hypothetical protein